LWMCCVGEKVVLRLLVLRVRLVGDLLMRFPRM
jgi:hypothetical protein